MTTRQLRLIEKNARREKQLLADLTSLAQDIERCEKTVLDLQHQLAEANAKYQGPRNTQQDIDYLSMLLDCAKKKLVWEKQIASLRKRTPLLLQEMTELLNEPLTAPSDQSRTEMLQKLQLVQTSMERLSAGHAE